MTANKIWLCRNKLSRDNRHGPIATPTGKLNPEPRDQTDALSAGDHAATRPPPTEPKQPLPGQAPCGQDSALAQRLKGQVVALWPMTVGSSRKLVARAAAPTWCFLENTKVK